MELLSFSFISILVSLVGFFFFNGCFLKFVWHAIIESLMSSHIQKGSKVTLKS